MGPFSDPLLAVDLPSVEIILGGETLLMAQMVSGILPEKLQMFLCIASSVEGAQFG